MSSSGQAPNVSMDDLLASIKSMIEGESSGEANSQVGSNLDSAPGMTPQGVGVDASAAPNNALDDGIIRSSRRINTHSLWCHTWRRVQVRTHLRVGLTTALPLNHTLNRCQKVIH